MNRAAKFLDVAAFLVLAALAFSRHPWDTRSALGLLIAASSFALWMLARWQLGRSFSVRAEAKELVSRGLYRRFRHPVYYFGQLAYLGLAVTWGHWIGYLWVALTFLIQLWRIRKEEAVLERAFGEQYRIHRANTWI